MKTEAIFARIDAMARRNKKLFKSITRHPKTTVVVVIIAAAAGIVFKGDNQPAPTPAPTHKPAVSVPAVKNNSGGSSSVAQGGATDNKGSGATSTSPSDWASSSSGKITLQQPTAGSTLRSGDTLSGTAKVDTVQYRLVDDSVGVLAQGSLSVVNGKFSGVLNFTPHSSSGKLDIFSYSNGPYSSEVNNIEVSLTIGS